MSNDRQILDDYVLWSTTRELDTSITAFLDERKAGEDAARVAEAINLADIYESNWSQATSMTPAIALNGIRAVRDILIDDRPTIDDMSLNGERRTILA